MDFSEKSDIFLAEYQKKTNISCIVRVTLKDNIVYERCLGFADRESGIPITSDAVYKFYYGKSDFAEPKLQMDVGYI